MIRYLAIAYRSEGSFLVEFPDFPESTAVGQAGDDPSVVARKLLIDVLWFRLTDQNAIPKPSETVAPNAEYGGLFDSTEVLDIDIPDLVIGTERHLSEYYVHGVTRIVKKIRCHLRQSNKNSVGLLDFNHGNIHKLMKHLRKAPPALKRMIETFIAVGYNHDKFNAAYAEMSRGLDDQDTRRLGNKAVPRR